MSMGGPGRVRRRQCQPADRWPFDLQVNQALAANAPDQKPAVRPTFHRRDELRVEGCAHILGQVFRLELVDSHLRVASRVKKRRQISARRCGDRRDPHGRVRNRPSFEIDQTPGERCIVARHADRQVAIGIRLVGVGEAHSEPVRHGKYGGVSPALEHKRAVEVRLGNVESEAAVRIRSRPKAGGTPLRYSAQTK